MSRRLRLLAAGCLLALLGACAPAAQGDLHARHEQRLTLDLGVTRVELRLASQDGQAPRWTLVTRSRSR